MFPTDEVLPEDLSQLPDEVLSDNVDSQFPSEGDQINSDVDEPQNNTQEEGDILPDEVVTALKSMIDEFDVLEQPVRERMVRYWKRCELFWKGIQNIYWDWTARDYRRLSVVEEDFNKGYEPQEELDYYYQDKIVNIYRAHGESVISALSQDIPAVIFPPDDANVIEDVQTSKGYSKAAELLQKCNKADMLLMQAIFTLWNQGLVGAYNYNCADEEYGTDSVDIYKTQDVNTPILSCPDCGAPMESQQPQICPYCQNEVQPIQTGETTTQQSLYDRTIEVPKKREKIELYGPLHVKIPHYVVNPKHSPYVRLETECHIDYARELFPNADIVEESDTEKFDRWARTSTDYNGDWGRGLVTIVRVWLREWTYNKFKKDNEVVYAYLRENFPNGIKVSLVNGKIVKAEAEKLDEHWTFSQSPLSTHLHAEPLGAPLLPIQEMRNELVVLKLQTIEYGIPETFADPSVLDFDSYNKHEAAPGSVYPAKIPSGGSSLESGFATLKTATFPKEANDFQQSLDSDGQFVTGAFPSIYGGSMPSASKTAAEYQMSRNQALQRLQTTWKVLSSFWAQVMDKTVRSFIAHMEKDEQFTKKQGKSYINVYIRQSELKGKVGSAEPELAQTFPMSWMQKKDLLIQMIQLNSEYVNSAIFHEQNVGNVAEYLGFRDFYIPGDDDRTKQLLEIQQMLSTEPMEESMDGELAPMEGPTQPQIHSTVPVDPLVDNHQVEFDTCIAWMKSEIGLDAKETNPAGYMNVRAHAAEHYFFVQQQMMQEAMMQQDGNEGGSSGNGNENPQNQAK